MSWLEEAKKRCLAATPGPWDDVRSEGSDGEYNDRLCLCRRPVQYPAGIFDDDINANDADYEFISKARMDLPRALELLERIKPYLSFMVLLYKKDLAGPGPHAAQERIDLERIEKWLKEVEG